MANRIFISATEPRSGKSMLAIGLINALQGRFPRVGYMKPVGRVTGGIDRDVELIRELFHFNEKPEYMNPASIDEAVGNKEKLYSRVFEAFEVVSSNKDIVVLEGTDYTSAVTVLEFDINAQLASNLNAPVILVANGNDRTPGEIAESAAEVAESFRGQGCRLLGVVVNLLQSSQVEKDTEEIQRLLRKNKVPLFGTLLRHPLLSGPRLCDVAEQLDAEVLYQGDNLCKVVTGTRVLAMTPENALAYMGDRNGYLLITPGDRVEHIFTALAAQKSSAYPRYSGIVLTGGLVPGENVGRLIRGLNDSDLTILSVQEDTFTASMKVSRVSGELRKNDPEKLRLVHRLVERYVAIDRIDQELGQATTERVTPRMFQYRILKMAGKERKHIVLPEGTEQRIIVAAAEALRKNICDVTLLGNRDNILDIAQGARADLEGVGITDIERQEDELEEFAETYYQLRKHKGVTRDMARDQMLDPVHFATMMVYAGQADGFVSGSTHSTANTLAPVLRIIRAREDVTVASSVFFMLMPDRVLVYGDCALVENPDSRQLADIAVTSADTAHTFGIEPYVALLSYSTGQSGKGQDVEKVREAAKLAQEKRPDLAIEGPIQYDAAVSEEVARIKSSDSRVAGRATVYIFPDLDAGNTAYKAVQRSAGVPAIGPVLQGLNKPANDLSRGATVTDIVYTIAVTAVQAKQSSARQPELQAAGR